MYEPLTLSDLIDDEDPAWPLVKDWLAGSVSKVEILPVDAEARDEALVTAQVTTRSPMGAVIYHTGGILVDNGWIRLLGSGCVRLPRAIHRWNMGRSYQGSGSSPPFYLIADDAAGGFFALNGGAFGDDHGTVYYHGPDCLEWEPLNMGYSAFLQWLGTPNLEEWSQDLRWEGWQADVESLAGDRAISFYPFLFTKEGSVATSSRRAVPVAELYDLYVRREGVAG